VGLLQVSVVDAPPLLRSPDPKGQTSQLLKEMGITFQSIDPGADLAGFDVLIIGKAALSVGGDGPDVSRVRNGLKVIIFEQSGEVLEKRFGFRVAEYGLRWVFKRVADHPLLAAIGDEHLWNWRGEATLLPSRLQYEIGPRYAPQVKWCDIPVTRLWRAGNRGNVAGRHHCGRQGASPLPHPGVACAA